MVTYTNNNYICKMEEFLKELPKLAKDKLIENKKYFQKLKKRTPKNLDLVMQDLHEKEFEKTDCLTCGNCCKNYFSVESHGLTSSIACLTYGTFFPSSSLFLVHYFHSAGHLPCCKSCSIFLKFIAYEILLSNFIRK